MRFAQTVGSDPASARLELKRILHTPGQVRVLIFLDQKRQTTTAT